MKRVFACLGAAAVVAVSADAAAGTAYYGGDVLAHARVRVIFYGDTFKTAPYFQQTWDAYADVVQRSQFYDRLRQYTGRNGEVIGDPTLDSIRIEPGQFAIQGVPDTHCAAGKNPCATKPQMMGVLNRYASNDPAVDQALYMLVVDPSAQAAIPNTEGGYHSAFQLADGRWVFYAIVQGLVDFTHELAEALTDPFPPPDSGTRPPPNWPAPAWAWSEIGDGYCAEVTTLLDGIPVQKIWSQKDLACVGYAQWPEFDAGSNTVINPGDGTVWNPGDGSANSSFVVAANEFWSSSPGPGQPIIAAINTRHDVDYKWFDGTYDWSPWMPPPITGWVSHIGLASAPGRVIDLVGVGGDERVYWRPALTGFLDSSAYWQAASDWPARDVAVARGGGGATTIYAAGTDGAVRYQSLGTTAQPSTSAWSTISGLPGPASTFAVGEMNSAVDVVAAVNGAWPPYLSRGHFVLYPHPNYVQMPFQALGNGNSSLQVKQVAAVLTSPSSPGGARIAVFALTNAGPWVTFDDSSDPSKIGRFWLPLALPMDTTQISVVRNADGRLELFGVNSVGNVWHVWQQSLNDYDWSAPLSRGGHVSTIQAFAWPTGQIEIFGFDPSNNRIAHDWKPTSTAAWVY